MLRQGERRWSCSGTPADCIVTAMTWLFRDGGRPDLVLSGVNDGKNVGEDIAYSGTLGVAREATFWGLPAIALSRVKNAEYRAEDAGFLADLVGRLWAARAEWLAEGHWLSVNLPARLPAPLAQPRIGRDKIALSAEVLSETAEGVELVVPRGRRNSSTKGDENSLLAQNIAAISRLAAFGETRLDEGFPGRLGSG
jgi:5'-nucleotidase